MAQTACSRVPPASTLRSSPAEVSPLTSLTSDRELGSEYFLQKPVSLQLNFQILPRDGHIVEHELLVLTFSTTRIIPDLNALREICATSTTPFGMNNMQHANAVLKGCSYHKLMVLMDVWQVSLLRAATQYSRRN